MTLTEDPEWKTYSDSFWRPELDNVAGTEALIKRNQESKRTCHDLEDYLRKRAKLESDYSKSLSALTKCFRERDEIGVLEASLSMLREELDVMARAHLAASEKLQKQAEGMRKFREEQTAIRKSIEESLVKAQGAKLTNLNKTIQAQKVYVKKSLERDAAELLCKERSISPTPQKDLDKIRNKAIKADEDAQKADATYQGSVMVLNGSREIWEKEMLKACQSIQELDEDRISELRKELWLAVNVDSKLALDIDNRCEMVRDVLEKCDIVSEIQAFIKSAGTGSMRPGPFEYTHYSKLAPSPDSDSGFNAYATIDDVGFPPTRTDSTSSNNSTSSQNSGGKFWPQSLGKAFKKKTPSTTE